LFSIIIIQLPKLFNIKVQIFACSIAIVDNVGSTIDFEQQNYLFTYYQPNVGNMIIDETFVRDCVKDL
jgi:ABC-type transport system involved in Fe-S cluster assembly fused permease/ATPase subunit